MIPIDHTLGYLREALSNHEDAAQASNLFHRLANYGQYQNEIEFIDSLESEEIAYLENLMEGEIRYADQAQDSKRLKELREVYDQLFPG